MTTPDAAARGPSPAGRGVGAPAIPPPQADFRRFQKVAKLGSTSLSVFR